MTEGVKNFLQSLGLVKYHGIFSAKGFDLETDLPYLTLSDLKETLMVNCEKERHIILSSAHRFKASSEHYVYEWLRRNSLDHYFINFIQSDLLDLEAVSKIKLPSEELYDELEIVLPGHRKRLERAVSNLRQEMQRRSVAEKPVTQGWWGKPNCLPQAKFDFLCVEGALFASQEPDKRVNVDFMVDSGSDVSTVQEETLASLNLELVGPIYSCGIHGGNHTNLYRAQLQIGLEQMAVEVIASNYDSLGSRVIRHFRHVIDGNRHIWLQGNYKDPLPAILPVKIPTKQNKGPQVLSIENEPYTSNRSSTSSSINKSNSPSKSDTTFKVPLPVSPSSSSNNSISSHPPTVHNRNRPSPKSPKLQNSSTHNPQLQNSQQDDDSQKSHEHSNTIVSNVQATKVVDLKDELNSSNCFYVNNRQDIKDSSSISTETGVKRPLDVHIEHSNANASLPKILKLDNQELDSSHVVDLTTRLNDVSEKACSSHSSGHLIPESSHSSSTDVECQPPRNASLLDTDDDVDHMTSCNEEYFVPSSNPSTNHYIHFSTAKPFIHPKHFDNSVVSHVASRNFTTVLSTDVVHVHSDEDDDDDVDGSDCRDMSKNFVPGNSASSVTISMVDLSTDFEINGD